VKHKANDEQNMFKFVVYF